MNTTDNARDFIDTLDALIQLRAAQAVNPLIQPSLNEDCEVIKRNLVDYIKSIQWWEDAIK